MKKRILFGIICIFTLFLVSGCDFGKTALTTEKFKDISEEKGLYAVDVKEQFKDFDFIKEATVAASQNGWQIEFYVLSDKDQAKSMYNKNYKTFIDFKSNKSKSSKVEIGNYTKFVLETSDFYRALTRVDNTFLYAEVPIAYKEQAQALIEALGY